MNGFLKDRLGERYTCFTIEAGTYSNLKIFKVMRHINNLKNSGFPYDKSTIVELFAPNDKKWWDDILSESKTVINIIIKNLL